MKSISEYQIVLSILGFSYKFFGQTTALRITLSKFYVGEQKRHGK